MTMILNQIAIGSMAIAVNVAIHASLSVAVVRPFRRHATSATTYLQKELLIIAVVMWFFLSVCVQCWTWSGLLLWFGALGSLEEALYFTTVTFTTLGYGDVVLLPEWRLLGAFAATNGTIIIGWVTAMLFLAVQRVYNIGSHRRDSD
jgi:hypothetical protein